MVQENGDRDDSELIADSIQRELSLGSGLTRFATGSVPVFAVGNEYVVKLFPAAKRAHFDTETAALTCTDHRLSIPTPQLVTTGERGQWLYVVMTRLSGCSLAEAWQTISNDARAQLMSQVGAALAELHALTTYQPSPLIVDWPRFVDAQRASCRERLLAKGLGGPWADLIDEFLATWPPSDNGARALLHTEIMREHLLVEQRTSGWYISGLVDFEPAMIGAPEYEFAFVGIFLTCGEPGLLRALLDSYGADYDDEFAQRAMAYALLHRYSDLHWFLKRLGVPDGVGDLEQLARRWFAL